MNSIAGTVSSSWQASNGATVLGRSLPTLAIAHDDVRNRVGVHAQDTELVLLINGEEVARARDDAFREGTFGFGVGNTTDGPAGGCFRNLLITTVD